MANLLIIGRRSKCYRTALELGHKVFLWCDGTLPKSRKEHLSGWIETPFDNCQEGLSDHIVEEIKRFNIDYVVAATESSVEIAAMIREIIKLPGTPLKTTKVLHNKYLMKTEAKKLHVPITKYALIEKTSSAESLIEPLGLPLVVKPLAESGARGVRGLHTHDEVRTHANPGLLAEAFVEGSEISVETFVHDGVPIFHNITEYLHQWKKSILPASLESELTKKILEINDQVISGFDVQNGMTHSEFYITKNGPVFGEMAVRPPGGYYMDLIELAYGFNPWKTYLEIEIGSTPSALPTKALKYACVMMIHPGPGIVQSITGLEKVKCLAEIDSLNIRVDVGSVVSEHVSTSSEIGHILISSSSQKTLLKRINFIEENLSIQMKT